MRQIKALVESAQEEAGRRDRPRRPSGQEPMAQAAADPGVISGRHGRPVPVRNAVNAAQTSDLTERDGRRETWLSTINAATPQTIAASATLKTYQDQSPR